MEFNIPGTFFYLSPPFGSLPSSDQLSGLNPHLKTTRLSLKAPGEAHLCLVNPLYSTTKNSGVRSDSRIV